MTGHIRRRGERSWELKYDVGSDPSTGRRKTRFVSFKGTKAEAQKELVRLVAAENSGQAVDPSRATVAEFLERWQRDWVAGNVGRKTAERWAELIRIHIVPNIGAKPIQKLRAVHLNELYARLLRSEENESGLAPRTVGHVHRALHRALGHAAQWGVIASNVASSVSPPRIASTELEILTSKQTKELLEQLRGRPLYMPVATALATGIRRGELLALRWKDVDLSRNDRAHLRIEQSLEQTRRGLRIKAPKTKHGRRTITLPDFLVTDLRAHRQAQLEQRVALGLGRPPDDTLIFGHIDGSPRRPDGLTQEWGRARRDLGLKVSLHAFRHTHASALIASGMDILTISRRLGHSSPTVTLQVYGHLFANTDDRAAQIVQAAFSSRTD
jgi:integrase